MCAHLTVIRAAQNGGGETEITPLRLTLHSSPTIHIMLKEYLT